MKTDEPGWRIPFQRGRVEARTRAQGSGGAKAVFGRSAVRCVRTLEPPTATRERKRDWLRSLAKVPVPLSRWKAEHPRARPIHSAQVPFASRQIRGAPFHPAKPPTASIPTPAAPRPDAATSHTPFKGILLFW